MWNVGASAAFSQGVGIPAFARAFPITRTVVDAPAPGSLSVFVLGMIGFASSRFKKQALKVSFITQIRYRQRHT
jgi:hypothetical protein